ncbi:hypothetical protein L2U69_04050 [Zavarzinia compransoris]|uniref:CCE_0567 family metalloprotein n=1 Tax=Zavarzinia marina TaxID=2911065 RepID=UPI001F1E9E29|nr:CCE_0567 family metalloprotein [Zavarzinia marina]MCF4164811.1 hypothetical protein [Zavarzinia marina]
MIDIDSLRAEVKKLSLKATKAKMDLHDLSEELPIDWQRIPEVAAAALDAFESLDAKRAQLRALESA